MKIIWLGHGSFRIEIDNRVMLIDPWLNGNPLFPAEKRQEALHGITDILISHGHFDHTNDSIEIAKETNSPIFGIADPVTTLFTSIKLYIPSATCSGVTVNFNGVELVRFSLAAL